MASSSTLDFLSRLGKEKLFKAAAQVTHKLENLYLETVGRKGRQSLGERFMILTVSGVEDSSGNLIITNVSVKEYAIWQVQTALDENENVVNLVIFMLAHLHRAGCLLNNRKRIATTGYVLVNVLSFVLLQLRKQGHKDVKSISIVVGDLVENRQDRMNGLEEDIHLQFWPIAYRKKNGEESRTNYALGELRDDKNQSENFLSGGVKLVTSEFHGIQGMDTTTPTTTAFLTAKGTYAAKTRKVIPSLKDQEPQSKILALGHPSNRRKGGRRQMQEFSTHVIICAGGNRPRNGEFLNDWHSDTPSRWFSPMITVDVSPLHNATPFTYEISSSFLLGSYEETGGGAESKKRMEQRIATAQAKREKRVREVLEKREKREKREREAREKREREAREKREKREKREREAREKRERAEEEQRLKREKKEAERQLEKEARRLEEEAIAKAKRVEKEEIEAAKLEFRIDAEKFSDTNDPEIIEALNEARGDLDTIDQELATLDASTEGLNYKENSEKCRELKTVRQKILYRFSELLSVVDENTREELRRMEKKRALDRAEERKKKKTSSLFDLL